MPKRIMVSQIFRTPVGVEKELGLWIDRMGTAIQRGNWGRVKARILGLYCAVYIEKGQGVLISGKDMPRKVFPGDVLLVKPRIPTCYYSMSGWKTRWIVWGGPEADRLEKICFQGRTVVRDVNESFNKAWTPLMQISSRDDVNSFLERKSVLLGMILGLNKASMTDAKPPGEIELRIDTIIEEMKKCPQKDYSVSDLAARSGLSIMHFRRIFRRRTGSTPTEILSSMRISMAKRLLYEGKSIKETAALSGFEDIFYFMRMFKKMTGITAGKFTSRQLR